MTDDEFDAAVAHFRERLARVNEERRKAFADPAYEEIRRERTRRFKAEQDEESARVESRKPAVDPVQHWADDKGES